MKKGLDVLSERRVQIVGNWTKTQVHPTCVTMGPYVHRIRINVLLNSGSSGSIVADHPMVIHSVMT